MAQSGYTPLSLYYSATASTAPTAGNLVAGELALNTADGKLYYKDSGGVVQVIASKAGNVNVSSFSGGTTGLTPNTATTGAVTLAGTLAVANGGTSFSTYTTGDTLYASASNTLSKLAVGTNGQILRVVSGAPAWGTDYVGTVTSVSGTGTVNGLTLTGTVTSSGSLTLGGTLDLSSPPAIGGTAASTGKFTSLTDTGLTSGRVTYATTGGLLTDSANMTFDGTKLTLANDASISGLTVGKGGGSDATSTAVGLTVLGSSNTGTDNNAFGCGSLLANTTGSFGVAVGRAALRFNTTGNYNTAIGSNALLYNTTASNNTAVGYQAGYSNTTGSANTYLGWASGYASTTGKNNTCLGFQAGYFLTTGSYNTFVGGIDSTGNYAAGVAVTTGSKNTILGNYSGNNGGLDIRTASNYIVLSDGDGNPRQIIDSSGNSTVGTYSASYQSTGVGFKCGPSIGAWLVQSGTDAFSYYQTSVGYKFYVNNAGGISSTNGSINVISDQRLKENIRDLDDGLEKIMSLKPRKFDWKEGKGADVKNERGFIAQEFETVFPDLVGTWNDPAPEGEEPYKSVRAELIPVLVKAIQELKAEVDSLKQQLGK